MTIQSDLLKASMRRHKPSKISNLRLEFFQVPGYPVHMSCNVCVVCGLRSCDEDLLCGVCLKKQADEISRYKQELGVKTEEEKVDRLNDLWLRFIDSQPSLSAFYNLNVDFVRKSNYRKDLSNFIKDFNTSGNNQGKGIAFLGDDLDKSRMLSLWVLRRLLKKYYDKDEGLVSFDYVHANECFSDVFGSPADNFYGSSDLLLLDSVDMKSVCENKHELKAFTSFIKYRADMCRVTLLVVHNAMSALPRPLNLYYEQAFQTKLFIA